MVLRFCERLGFDGCVAIFLVAILVAFSVGLRGYKPYIFAGKFAKTESNR